MTEELMTKVADMIRSMKDEILRQLNEHHRETLYRVEKFEDVRDRLQRDLEREIRELQGRLEDLEGEVRRMQ